MRKPRLFILLLIFCTICQNSFSQDKKNAVVFEALGKSFYYFDLSYERYLSQHFHFGAGLGFAGRNHIYFKEGDFLRYNFSIPLYCGYTFGHHKNHVFAELGTTLKGYTGQGGSVNSSDALPFVSCGYEYRGDRFFFRVPAYLLYVGRTEFFPSVIPWIGFSIGRFF